MSHRVVLNVLWFVLVTGCRWADVPPELGCSGMTAHRCLRRWEQMGCWDRLHADLLRLLRKAGIQLLLNRLAPNDRYAPFKYRDAER